MSHSTNRSGAVFDTHGSLYCCCCLNAKFIATTSMTVIHLYKYLYSTKAAEARTQVKGRCQLKCPCGDTKFDTRIYAAYM